jgi:hypothetical protein
MGFSSLRLIDLNDSTINPNHAFTMGDYLTRIYGQAFIKKTANL